MRTCATVNDEGEIRGRDGRESAKEPLEVDNALLLDPELVVRLVHARRLVESDEMAREGM